VNVLFVTLDQFRGDAYGAAGHPLVRTPTLDRLANEGVRLSRHYSQAAPCAPGRAALYTGMYQMNNRVVANGTPLARGFDNLAYVARRAGYDPTLFGYTDQGLDPATANGADDPRLNYYDGILPGFSVGLYLPESQAGWVQYLRQKGYDVSDGWRGLCRGEPDRPAEDSLSGFLTTRFLEWLDHQEAGWFAHLSYLRPHPPYAAAGEYASFYDPADVELPIAPVDADRRHPLHEAALSWPQVAAPSDEGEMRHLKAQYFGMISEVDAQLGRAIAAINQRGEWGDTLIVITSDHGEQLGDHGLLEKMGFFPQSYHIIGIWRDPREKGGTVVTNFTENVDLLATLADALDVEQPVQSDGASLVPLLRGEKVPWREMAHYEWDSRFMLLGATDVPSRDTLARRNLAVSVGEDVAFVQFGDGSMKCFDLANDPTWRTECDDLERVFHATQQQLLWRQAHLRHDLTDMLLSPERRGRWPSERRLDSLAKAAS
jgi:arylsulfatase A-like enzyme